MEERGREDEGERALVVVFFPGVVVGFDGEENRFVFVCSFVRSFVRSFVSLSFSLSLSLSLSLLRRLRFTDNPLENYNHSTNDRRN